MDLLFYLLALVLSGIQDNVYNLIILYCTLIGTAGAIIGLFVISSKISIVSSNISNIHVIDNSINKTINNNSFFEVEGGYKSEF